jgi:hypothetical protein
LSTSSARFCASHGSSIDRRAVGIGRCLRRHAASRARGDDRRLSSRL